MDLALNNTMTAWIATAHPATVRIVREQGEVDAPNLVVRIATELSRVASGGFLEPMALGRRDRDAIHSDLDRLFRIAQNNQR